MSILGCLLSVGDTLGKLFSVGWDISVPMGDTILNTAFTFFFFGGWVVEWSAFLANMHNDSFIIGVFVVLQMCFPWVYRRVVRCSSCADTADDPNTCENKRAVFFLWEFIVWPIVFLGNAGITDKSAGAFNGVCGDSSGSGSASAGALNANCFPHAYAVAAGVFMFVRAVRD